MSTLNELFSEVENEVNDIYKNIHRAEILKAIDDLISLLNGKTIGINIAKEFKYYGADELTRFGGRLAIYQYNLIEYELEAFKNMKKAELSIDVNRASIRQKLLAGNEKKPNETDIKIKTDSMLIKYELLKGLHEAELNKLTALKFSVNTIIGRIESRIKYLLTTPNQKLTNE